MAVESTETACRIQAAVADLTAKADSKASFALTMQSTALAVLEAVALSILVSVSSRSSTRSGDLLVGCA